MHLLWVTGIFLWNTVFFQFTQFLLFLVKQECFPQLLTPSSPLRLQITENTKLLTEEKKVIVLMNKELVRYQQMVLQSM